MKFSNTRSTRSAARACGGDFFELAEGRGRRLLQGHVLAGAQRGDGDIAMQVMRQEDVDGVDVGVAQHLVDVG